MPNCSFCDAKEEKDTPLCQSCGSLRYPVANSRSPATSSKQDKIKLSVTLAVAIITPGSLLILALVGANRLNSKLNTGKYKSY